MAGRWHERRCSSCGKGTLRDDVRPRDHEYRGKIFRASYEGAYCDHCNEAMLYHDESIDDAYEKFCRTVDESERAELAAIRARLRLTQEEASKLTGGGHNAFSRYERGEAQPVLAVINLFRLLDRHPELLREFGHRPYAPKVGRVMSSSTANALGSPIRWVVNTQANVCPISAVIGSPIAPASKRKVSYLSSYSLAEEAQ